MAGQTNRDPGEQKHVITGRLVDWATRDGGGAGQAADAVRSVLDEFLPGRYLSSVLSSAPRKQRSGAERTAARGHAGERRLGAGNGQGADGPEADREHAVEDLRAACARAFQPDSPCTRENRAHAERPRDRRLDHHPDAHPPE